ncbi:MAG: hypothetical protein CMO01_01650, partial [Thalassobius sp.]|nr:hypothetical protein [Thalassovita sp.]
MEVARQRLKRGDSKAKPYERSQNSKTGRHEGRQPSFDQLARTHTCVQCSFPKTKCNQGQDDWRGSPGAFQAAAAIG